MRTKQTKSKAGVEQLVKATVEIGKVVDRVLNGRLELLVAEAIRERFPGDKPGENPEWLAGAVEQLRRFAWNLVGGYAECEPQGQEKEHASETNVAQLDKAKTGGAKREPWWKDVGTQAVANMRAAADQVRANSVETKALLLGCIETMLAGTDILAWDCVEVLREERGTLQGGMQTDQVPEEDVEEAAEEIAKGDVMPLEHCIESVTQVEQLMDGWPVEEQRAALYYATQRLAGRERLGLTELKRMA